MAEPIFEIVIPLYPDITHLDFTGPHQVLCRLPGARVTVASMGGQKIVGDGLVFAELAKLEDVERCDLICVPGGFGTTDAMNDPAFMAEIRRLGEGAQYLTSVCTGSLILGAAGFLQGKRAACHWAWRSLLTEFGAIPDESRVARDGNIITGGGVTAGIDTALTIAAELRGDIVARSIQLGLEYAPQPPFNSGRPETAPPEVLAFITARMAEMQAERQAERQAAAERAARELAPA